MLTCYKVFLNDLHKGDNSIFRLAIDKCFAAYKPLLEKQLQQKKEKESQKKLVFKIKTQYSYTDEYKSFPELSYKAWSVSTQDVDYTVIESQSDAPISVNKCWLISWSPKNWAWEDYDQICADTTDEHVFFRRWACHDKKPKIDVDKLCKEIKVMRPGAVMQFIAK